jgi:hypothetical protein
MLLNVSDQLEDALPPGIETQGDVEDVVRLIARAILDLHGRPGYLGFVRMVAADSRGSRGSARRSRPSQSSIAVGGRRSLGSAGGPSVPRLDASLGVFTGTLRIGDRLRVLRLLAAGFVVASVLGPCGRRMRGPE